MSQIIPKTGSLVLRCNEAVVIQEILYTNLKFEPGKLSNTAFINMAEENKLDPMLHFLEALKQFGYADGWHLPLKINKKILLMTCSGLSLDRGFVIVANIFQDTAAQENTSRNLGQVGMESQVSRENNQLFTSDMNEQELLDELSRLNNELINNKRELMRQNAAMERNRKK
jgi:hypothetical protein